MRTYKNGELVSYSDEVAVVTRTGYDNDDYSDACYFATVAQACESIENNELDGDGDELCVVKVEESYDGTDYVLKAEYSYDEEDNSYQLAHSIM